MKGKQEIILGIDPGTLVMGFGLIQIQNKEVKLLEMGVLKLSKYDDNYEKLNHIYRKISELIRLYQPGYFAIEAPFFGKNVQSMLKLGRAQGVAIAAAMQYSLPVTEYSPKKVKQAVTGNGNAGKEQVWKMLQKVLKLQEEPDYFDATDAVAVALCHYFQMQSPLPLLNKSKGWDSFLKNNAHRIKK
ncbi:MAG: crossover junction endodeoxyribonuclease RuvC [Chitinophagaceae bacterium]|nr:crossover junction endodeoxyribonuclease RuvC [Chitinophagaceae bacterium]